MGNYREYSHNCIQCDIKIDYAVHNYSTQNYGQPLCQPCQGWFQNVISYSSATRESINLYFALKRLGVPALIEVNDGHKTVDISVPEAKVHIEVDGKHHNNNSNQALADLKRTFYSFKEGFVTLRIPNSLAKYHLNAAANLVTDFLVESRDRTQNKKSNYLNKDKNIGFCIRCKSKLDFNPNKPFCYDCFSNWVQWENYTYQENSCHCCGKDDTTSMSKPLCYECYRTSNNINYM